MRRDLRGRQACKLSDYHTTLAAKARARYEEMRVMRARGKGYLDIAIAYGVSESVVRRIFKRYEGA